MNESKRRYVRRQYNYNRVPNPLVEGLVSYSFGPGSEAQQAAWSSQIEGQQAENRMALALEEN
jgi:hypothetical protein